MQHNRQSLEKVQFYDPDVGYENLWATRMNDRRYRIESIPFFIYGISVGDVITATPDKEGRLQFRRVVKRSGHRTLRARSDSFVRSAVYRKKVIGALKKLGSEIEVLGPRLLAIDVSPAVDLEAVTDFLTNDSNVSWEYGHPENLND